MKVGLATIYAFRPHVEHAYFLKMLLMSAGFETCFLTCDASVSACYARLLKGHGKLRECPVCIAGGLRSYGVHNITSVARSSDDYLSRERAEELTFSSSATLCRTETMAEFNDPEVKAVRDQLCKPVQIAYAGARRWIEREGLDAIVCFNGRMELTAAVIQAAKDCGLPFVTFERTWFGHGLQLIPNQNCLALGEVHRMTAAFRDVSLSGEQAYLAARQVAQRFLRQNDLEWRVYNRSATISRWPAGGGGPRVLIIPSSKNEVAGHPDWAEGWGDNTRALDELIGHLDLDPSNCVVRCHPNWGEMIGCVSGRRSELHYMAWAERRGVTLIPARDRRDTYDLLQEADIAVLNGGSTAVEAAMLGKPVVCIGPANYCEAGLAIHVNGPGEWGHLSALERHDPLESARRTLRFLYTQLCRFPQYVDYVRAVTTTHYDYCEGADAARLVNMLQTGKVEPDDPTSAATTTAEDSVLAQVFDQRWAALASWEETRKVLSPLTIRRRFGLRWLDMVRSRLPLGDRWREEGTK
jgi:hypothetical protein